MNPAPSAPVPGPSPPALFPRPRSVAFPADRRSVPARRPVESLDRTLPPQGYRVEIDDEAVRLQGADDAGLRHGRATLAQLGTRAGADNGAPPDTLPACRVEDWPDFAVRGVMVDVARDRVPTLATVEALVDRLASWKVNQLQLYMEHTFSYRGHDEVWRHASPYTPEDMAALDAHCAARGVELVANQNTLGHFERWLRHDRYRPLAISPDGFEWVFGIRRPPLTLDPAKEGSFALVTDLLGQLVPLLDSRRVHVGMDEPWELPPQRHGEWGAWLERLRALEVLEGHELLVWGDVPATHPDLLAAIPSGVTVCEWGYEDDHPFDERSARLADAGVPFWVCPGTSSWLSLAGRFDNMLGNVAAAARAGRAHGAEGLLVTDWGDMGYLQQPPVSDPGLAVAAGMGWCVDAHADMDADAVASVLDAHCYHDTAGRAGRAVVSLGRASAMVTPRPPNMSALALGLLLPQWKVGTALTAGLRPEELDDVDAMLDDVTSTMGGARLVRPDAALVRDEIAATVDLLRWACHDARLRLAGDGTLSSLSAAQRAALGDDAARHIDAHRRLWRERFRPGGLDNSTAWLEHVADCYRTGAADRSWFGPYG